MFRNKLATMGVSLLAGLVITGGVVFAAGPGDMTKADTTQSTGPSAYVQEIAPPEKAEPKEVDDPSDKALFAKVALTADQAINVVRDAYPGCSIGGAEGNDENGVLVYGVSITDKDGKLLDVKVDANTGKILSAESDAVGSEEAASTETETTDSQEADSNNVEQEGEYEGEY